MHLNQIYQFSFNGPTFCKKKYPAENMSSQVKRILMENTEFRL